MKPYLLQHYLDNSAEKYPHKIALTYMVSQVSYLELYHLSNKLANCLISEKIRRQNTVAIFLTRSHNWIIAIMGVLKADAIYVPIDIETPGDRVLKIIADCKPDAIICDGAGAKRLEKILPGEEHHPKLVVLEPGITTDGSCNSDLIITPEKIESHKESCPCYTNVSTDVAYILYTSGSTGRPKGVMISHLNVTSYIDWGVEYFGMSDKDVLLGTAPFHFDMSTFDIFAVLRTGARFCIAPKSLLIFPGKLLDLIENQEITIWKCISSLLAYVVRTYTLKPDKFDCLKRIIFSGERLPTKHLITWMSTYPHKRFYNAYGPTEATGISTCYQIKEIPQLSSQSIPIGRACTNTDIVLLNDDGGNVPVGEIGEIVVRGTCVSKGYLNDASKTKKSFFYYATASGISDWAYRTGDLAFENESGDLEFVARKDNQIKYMGYRIELDEIENAILLNANTQAAAVIFHKSNKYNIDAIFAFVEQIENEHKNELQYDLKKRLPEYMMPKKIFIIDSIPRNDRGKVDKSRLIKIIDSRDE